ncbi:Ribonuclease [Dirofilaria immitis]
MRKYREILELAGCIFAKLHIAVLGRRNLLQPSARRSKERQLGEGLVNGKQPAKWLFLFWCFSRSSSSALTKGVVSC